MIWNSGSVVITAADVARAHPITIEPRRPEQVIIDASVLVTNSKYGDVKVSVRDEMDRVTINFDYLSPNEGLVLRVLHTATEATT